MSPDTVMADSIDVLRFCGAMQTTLRGWHPELKWIVSPHNEDPSCSTLGCGSKIPSRFIILAGHPQHEDRELKPLVGLFCSGEDYHDAPDQDKWLRGAAGKVLMALPVLNN